MAIHGNSHKNEKPHHLYKIGDRQEDDILKYGISDKPIGEDGLSLRIRVQLKQLNLGAGWLRYFGEVLIRGIQGRIKAKQIEQEFIDTYARKHGRKPRGNSE